MQSGWVASPVFPCQVRCAGCSGVLNVPPGCAEFRCPRCKLPQVLPPELMQHATLKPPGQGSVAQGVDPSKVQLPCAHCKSLLNVPHGLTRFNCPQCKVELAVDHSKLQNYISALSSQPLPAPFITNLGSSSSDGSQPEHEVGTEIDREDDENGTVGETFMEYNPSNLALGTPHPDPVVETSSLSAIASPQLHYQLKIGKEIQKTQALSCLQIETIVLASQRHEQHLPDKMRAGFFMGDGAGVGKGRTIAGLIWENWHHGRCRAVWLSVSSDLQFDARRDLDDVGATCVKVHPLNKLPYSKLDSKAVGIMDGVIFSTYSSLIASSEKGQTRLKQLIQWCGQDSDCLLIFDECHKAKNLVPEAGSQATRTGEAVRDIQMKMPEARVVYCSATGASEPRNMAYMVRLGLWGDGTCFPKFENFLEALDKGGVGALELVAMDMKARGMYVCRTLSYKGAEFDVVDAPLEAEMKEMYHRATAFWAKFRLDLMSAIESYGEEQNHKFLWRLFWASQQRFFRHMCLSAKVPAVVRLSKQALQEDKCIVIGLQTTGEARTEEAVTKYGPELEDFVSGPRELLLKLVEEHYPLPQRPPELPGDGDLKELGRKRKQASRSHAVKGRMRKAARMKGSSNVESDYETESEIESAESDDDYQICDVCYNEDPVGRLIECSCCGKPVHLGCMGLTEKEYDGKWTCMKCQERTNEYAESSRLYLAEMWKRFEAAKERKSQFLEAIRALDLPNNPLDDIIDQLGGAESVAEMTGRRGRLVRDASGKIVYQARNTKEVSMEMVNMHEKQLFMDGKKLVAVISEAGSAGLSLQADKRAKNQKRRVHITLELPWSADRAIQQFGRTHRSNQASAPQYRLLFSSLGGECRFASTVAKRLESLGALTQGDRRAGPSLSAYNFDSPYGKKALNMMYKAIMGQVELSVLPPGCSADEMERISTFHNVAKAALMTVGIVRDSISGPGSQLAKFSGRILDSDMNDVGRFLNRLLAIEPDVQNRIFEYFLSIFDYEINNARKEGNFDSGIVDIKANTIDLIDSPMIVYEDEMSKASTTLFKLKMDRGMSWEAAHRILEESSMDSRDDGFYESKRDWFHRKHFLLATEGSKSTTNRMLKIYRPANSFPRDMPLAELLDKYKKVSSLEIARKEWEKELERSAVQCMHGPNCKVGAICSIGKRILEIHVLGGLILPVWSKIEKALSMQVRQAHRRLRVVRLETSDDRRIVGVHIPNTAINSVLEDLKSSI